MPNSTNKGKLYLIPAPLEEENLAQYLPAEITTAIREIKHFVVEELKTARRYLKKIHKEKNIDECTFHLLNEHSKEIDLARMLEVTSAGENVGLLSEAGCPGIADPGQVLVLWAHQQNIQVVPLVGPSSILLALMASGLNGQQFKFNGYLPKDQHARKQKLKELENDSRKTSTAHLFIETPYRNNHMFTDIVQNLHAETFLTIACEVKAVQEFIKTKTIADWKKQIPNLDKKNTVFVIQVKV